MAATVVSQYVLPMFENKGKIKSKYASIMSKHKTPKSLSGKLAFKEDDTTVYGELKLSQKLQV